MSIARLIEGLEQEVVACTPKDSVLTASRLLAERRIGALPVMEGNKVAGIFSERDLLYCIARDGAQTLERPVGEVMTSPAISIGPGDDVDAALSLMTKRRIRHLPVLEGDTMLAFVSIGDLVKYKIEQIEHEAEQMRDYITMS